MNISTQRFQYNANTRQFVAEASDLGPNMPQFHLVYADSADVGMMLVSHCTGVGVEYVVTNTVKDEGDVMFWKLEPTKSAKKQHPLCIGTSVVIFND